MTVYRRLLGYLRPFARPFVFGLLGGALFAASQSAFLWFLKVFLDGTFFEHDRRMLAWVPIGIVVLFAVRGLGDFIQTYYMSLVGRGVVKNLRAQLFDRFVRLPVAYFDTTPAGTMLSRLTFNTEQVAQAATDSVISALRESLIIIGSLVYLLSMNVHLTAVALTVVPLIAVLIRAVNKHFRRYGERMQGSIGDVTSIAKEAIEAPRAIRAFNAQDAQIARFDSANERNRRAAMRLSLTRALSNPVVQMLAAVALAIVLGLAIQEALAGRLTTGEFVAFIGALANMTQPLRNLVNVASPMQQGLIAAQSVFQLIDAAPEPNHGVYRVKRARGQIEFRDVSLSYSHERGHAVHRLSFEAQPGQTIAIVGASGSGKSTLVSLLPRFYRPSSGRVLVDGKDVEEFELENLRDQIAIVSQDVVLLNDTLRNNISFGRAVNDADIEKAAATARVLDFAKNLPNGLDTVVGERGSLLSGGQRQRIAIARALVTDAPILILDEATGALDAETERAVQSGIAALMKERTTLVIAHRLTTVERADQILVMHAGAIVERGTHSELLAKDGRYALLYRQQFALAMAS